MWWPGTLLDNTKYTWHSGSNLGINTDRKDKSGSTENRKCDWAIKSQVMIPSDLYYNSIMWLYF